MKKKPDVSTKARSAYGWNKHLRPLGKRIAWKSSRRITKAALVKEAAMDVDDV